MMKLNSNIKNLKESSTLKINQKAKRDRASGENIFHFGFGQSPFPVPEIMQQELSNNLHQKDYLPTRGHVALRDQISKYYKEFYQYDFSRENILIGPGSKELIFQALMTIEGTVIIPAPSWVSYGPQVNARGKDFSIIQTKFENQYCLKAYELENFCKNNSDEQYVLILNSPNNPTGAIYQESDIKEIVTIAKKYNVFIISDEIYSEVYFTDRPKINFFNLYPEGTIVTGGISKGQSAGGWRLGFMATSQHLENFLIAMSGLISETFSAVSSPIQYASVSAFSGDDEILAYLESSRNALRVINHQIHKELTANDIMVNKSKGAFYMFPNFVNYSTSLLNNYQVKTSIDLCEELYKRKKVALLPGTDFYMPIDSLTCRLAFVDLDGAALLESLSNSSNHEEVIHQSAQHMYQGIKKIIEFMKGK